MKTFGNILWFILIGLWSAISWFLGGVIFCITIIGIPFGKQCFKIAKAVLTPFGKTITTNFDSHPIANIIWIVFFGWELAVSYVITAAIFCVTIIGIPFGKQCFKLAKIGLLPFGSEMK